MIALSLLKIGTHCNAGQPLLRLPPSTTLQRRRRFSCRVVLPRNSDIGDGYAKGLLLCHTLLYNNMNPKPNFKPCCVSLPLFPSGGQCRRFPLCNRLRHAHLVPTAAINQSDVRLTTDERWNNEEIARVIQTQNTTLLLYESIQANDIYRLLAWLMVPKGVQYNRFTNMEFENIKGEAIVS